jgi:hypothetical protein
MIVTDARAVAAAGNNADLYEAVFTAHALRYRREPHAFIAIDPPPPFYAGMTTTSPAETDVQTQEILRRTKSGGGFTVKDSFSNLDGKALGMDILFEAHWLWAQPSALLETSDPNWQRISDGDELERWELGWAGGNSPTTGRVFPDTMLSQPGIAFFGRQSGMDIRSGCIANISKDCVGISNLFSEDDQQSDYRAAVACVAQFAPTMPVVGYERGADLELMRSMGFAGVGRLTVWIGGA